MSPPAAAAAAADPFDVRHARRAHGLLLEFNRAGVLTAADVHVAQRLGHAGQETDESVLLAVALAVRAPRLGHVFVDLATIGQTAVVETDEPVDLRALAWPAAAAWTKAVAESSLVAVGEQESASPPPLRLLDGRWLYLDRYWQEERRLAADLLVFAADGPQAPDADRSGLAEGLRRLFPEQTDGRQCLAAASAVLRRLTVVAGGPGTGKTTTVARIVALLAEQGAGMVTAAAPAPNAAPSDGASHGSAEGVAAGRWIPPLVALAAPTGKAAARLEEAVHAQARDLPVEDRIREELLALRASTLHRLLGWRSGSHSRFLHHRGQRLPHDVVIVDETSMVSLSLMARLVEAVRPEARLILVGDPGQLASIEAGAVLGDIVGPAAAGLVIGAEARALLAAATGHPVTATGHALPGVDPPRSGGIGDGIVVLDRVHRYGGGIARLADAIRGGDVGATLDVLREGPEGVQWIPVDAGSAVPGLEGTDPLAPVRARAVAAARAVTGAARAGAAGEAIAALGSFRVLCAHRRGPDGVTTWTTRIEGWLAGEVDGLDTGSGAGFGESGPWYLGRPLLVSENDYELRLYNGDTGVVVQSGPDRVSAAFERRGEILDVSPSRLSAVETVYAMTIHKSQGSQFDTVAVLLPAPTSRILTRELLYTAATRARERLILVGSEESVRAAVGRPIARASGLGRRLWATGA